MCFVFGIHLRYVGDIMKKFFLLFTALFLFFASGCQVTPEIKIGYDGVTKAENENDRVIESIHNKVPTVTFEFESSHINKKITSANKSIIINADVVISGVPKEMCVYDADYVDFSTDKLSDILYGTDEKPGMYTGDKSSASITFPTGSGFQFGVTEVLSSNNHPIPKGENYAPGCDISFDAARRKADDFLIAMSIDDYKLIASEIVQPISYGNEFAQSGYYQFNYVQHINGFPLETVTANVTSGVSSTLSVGVDDRGIMAIRMSGLDFSLREDVGNKIMPVEDAIDLIEMNLDTLWLSSYAPIIEIRLEYLLDEIQGRLVLFPCWHFCIDQTEIHNLPLEEARKNDTNDLCINAVTGEMFRVGDRYPVFQTSR